jgi:hypothetical protein
MHSSRPFCCQRAPSLNFVWLQFFSAVNYKYALAHHDFQVQLETQDGLVLAIASISDATVSALCQAGHLQTG